MPIDPRMWKELAEPVPLKWTHEDVGEGAQKYRFYKIEVGDKLVATLEARPPYCDRGRFIAKCFLPGLDGADGFPRYYMHFETAKEEMVLWLRWRLWQEWRR